MSNYEEAKNKALSKLIEVQIEINRIVRQNPTMAESQEFDINYQKYEKLAKGFGKETAGILNFAKRILKSSTKSEPDTKVLNEIYINASECLEVFKKIGEASSEIKPKLEGSNDALAQGIRSGKVVPIEPFIKLKKRFR